MTVLAGRLPPQRSTTGIVLTPAIARLLGVGVGGRVQLAFPALSPQGRPVIRSYRLAAIGEIPPALVGESDHPEGTILPPGATRQVLARDFYAWVGLRLARGTAGIPALQDELAGLTRKIQRLEDRGGHRNLPGPAFSINRQDVIHSQVQQAIAPQAIALTVLGVIAGMTMLLLVTQGLAQMISRSAPDVAVIRVLGATRAHAALAASLPGAIAILGGSVLGVAGAVAISPMAPVGPVRPLDPARGIRVDGLVLGAGETALTVILLGLLAALAMRSGGPRKNRAASRPSAIASAVAASGLPAAAVVDTRYALEPGSDARVIPVRSTLLGSIAAVAAVVIAAVFGSSLSGLISHPARYGWNWDVVLQAEAGYESFTPGVMSRPRRCTTSRWRWPPTWPSRPYSRWP